MEHIQGGNIFFKNFLINLWKGTVFWRARKFLQESTECQPLCPYDLGLSCLKRMDVCLTPFKLGGEWNSLPQRFFLTVATNINRSASNFLP